MRVVDAINHKFGTWRGLVRLALSYPQALGVPRADLSTVRRVVFVCHGNICRSAYADVLATNLGLRAASFGLSTSDGLLAHPPIVAAARGLGVDVSGHLTTTAQSFAPKAGDLLLAMEVRQVTRLRRDPRFAGLQIDLLGRYAGVPHLHDPYELNEDYVVESLSRIDRAVRNLVARLPAARSS